MQDMQEFMAILRDRVQRESARDPQLRAALRHIESSTATFKDTALWSERWGTILGEVYGKAISDIPLETRRALTESLLREQYESANEILASVQRTLDEAQGLHLAPQKAAFPAERVAQFAASLTDQTVPEETVQRRARAGTANISKSFHDAYMKENAKFRTSAGLKCYITRTGASKCCEWCAEVAGKYEYQNAPDDVFRRHDNCSCTVYYDTNRTRQTLQGNLDADGNRTKTWEVIDEVPRGFVPTVFTDETRPQGFVPTILTGGQKPAIIKLPDIQIGRSVGAKAKNYDIMDLQTGEHFSLAEGTRLQNVEVFAGKGVRTPYRNAGKFAEIYGGKTEDWQHAKGIGVVDFYGEDRSAELHWSQCEGIGKFEFFIKRWLE